jgi:hypothetical protein
MVLTVWVSSAIGASDGWRRYAVRSPLVAGDLKRVAYHTVGVKETSEEREREAYENE